MVTSVLPSICLAKGLDLLDGLGEAHAALVAGGGFLELALAAAAGMDLATSRPRAGPASSLRRGLRLVAAKTATPAETATRRIRFSTALPWYSWIFMRLSPVGKRRCRRRCGPDCDASGRDVLLCLITPVTRLICLQASMRPCTEATDFVEHGLLVLAEIRPRRCARRRLAPITTGTPTKMSFTPYWPLR